MVGFCGNGGGLKVVLTLTDPGSAPPSCFNAPSPHAVRTPQPRHASPLFICFSSSRAAGLRSLSAPHSPSWSQHMPLAFDGNKIIWNRIVHVDKSLQFMWGRYLGLLVTEGFLIHLQVSLSRISFQEPLQCRF